MVNVWYPKLFEIQAFVCLIFTLKGSWNLNKSVQISDIFHKCQKSGLKVKISDTYWTKMCLKTKILLTMSEIQAVNWTDIEWLKSILHTVKSELRSLVFRQISFVLFPDSSDFMHFFLSEIRTLKNPNGTKSSIFRHFFE